MQKGIHIPSNRTFSISKLCTEYVKLMAETANFVPIASSERIFATCRHTKGTRACAVSCFRLYLPQYHDFCYSLQEQKTQKISQERSSVHQNDCCAYSYNVFEHKIDHKNTTHLHTPQPQQTWQQSSQQAVKIKI
jgi:hypothetical protein